MNQAKDSGDLDRLRRTFEEVCAHHQPVFRFFFLEYFAGGGAGDATTTTTSAAAAAATGGSGSGGGSGGFMLSSHLGGGHGSGGGGGAAEWYERRLTYSSSLAVSSMVGHIMGIGDRHTQNILVSRFFVALLRIDSLIQSLMHSIMGD